MRTRETAALAIVALVGAPLVFFFARAVADGTIRYRETPMRAVLGDGAYEELVAGTMTSKHYLGENLRMPEFTVLDRDGKPVHFGRDRDKMTVLNVWTITCKPCIEELPTLEVLAQVAEGWGDVEVIGLSVDAGWDAVSAVLPKDPKMTILFDPERTLVADKLGQRLYPETWIIDRKGMIRFRYDGQLDWSDPLVIELVESFR